MAVETRITKPLSFIGLSTDEKNTSDIDAGVEWYETDTGETYIWSNKAWVRQTENQLYIRQADGTYEPASRRFPFFTEDEASANKMDHMIDVMERVNDQLGVITETPLGFGERLT